MFLILPHSAQISHGKIPWVVATIMLLCVGIYLAQESRKEAIQPVLESYCASIHDDALEEDSLDYLRVDESACVGDLAFIHALPDKPVFSEFVWRWADEYNQDEDEPLSDEEVTEVIHTVLTHYEAVKPDLPPSLDAKLSYDPQVPNPFRSLLSALSHADWWHLIGNLIFFIAFAPAIEFIIGSTWRFILSIIAIELICDVTYSLTMLMGVAPYPTLGLSGVVYGMIGMAAYLAPNIRIRTFVWFLHFARNLYIPAIFLAAWYIGWDTYYLLTSEWDTGVNLVAHVSAGFAGYFIARFMFKNRREETREEVDDEVNYQRALRADRLGTLSSYRSQNAHFRNIMEQDSAKRDYANWVDTIHMNVQVGKDAEAINHMLARYEEYRNAIELYEELYESARTWPVSRTQLCLIRLLIHENIALRRYAKAIQLAQEGYAITSHFVFAEKREGDFVDVIAKKQGVSLRTSSEKGQ